MKPKKETYVFYTILGLVLTGAFILRAIGVKWGLPMAFHPDEPHLVLASKNFFSGDFNPHSFLYPSLLMYIMHIVHRIYYLFVSQPVDITPLYIMSRLTVAAFGVGSVMLSAILGKRLFNKYVGLGAAILLSVSSLHVINSHYATTDVPLSFFMLLTIIFTIQLAQKKRMLNYILAGLAFGLTVSVKIPGVVMFVPIFVAHLYCVKEQTGSTLRDMISKPFSSIVFHIINIIIALAGAAIVFLAFMNFDMFASAILSKIQIELWTRYYDIIVQHASMAAFKYALLFFLGMFFLLTFRPIIFHKIKKLVILVGVSLFAFFLTTPFAILDFKAFSRDFLFQSVISQTSWGGQFVNSAPAYITNYSYLLNDLGLPLILLALLGIVVFIIRPQFSKILLLISAFIYYGYLGTWKIMFDRYMVPMLPLVILLAMAGLYFLYQVALQKFTNVTKYGNTIVLAVLIGFICYPFSQMLGESIGFDKYLLKKNTKTIAYEWACETIPQSYKILREQYAPELEIAGYNVVNVDYTFNDSVNVDYIKKMNIDYIIVTDKLWKRNFIDKGILKERDAYQKVQDYADEVFWIKPSVPHPGPEIKIYKVRGNSLAD
jgi:hypothetical protein